VGFGPGGRDRGGHRADACGVEATRALGPIFLPYFLGSLAEGYVNAGRVHFALDNLAEALAAVESTGERFYEAELRRLQGELLLAARIGPRTRLL